MKHIVFPGLMQIIILLALIAPPEIDTATLLMLIVLAFWMTLAYIFTN